MSNPSAWLASQMPKESIHDWDNIDWVQDFLKQPGLKEVPFQSRTITRNSTIHSLFNRTLATNDTLRACQAFHLYKEDAQYPETYLLASLGHGLDGHPGLAHGATFGILFDEGLSLGALSALENAFFTATTNIQYKAPMPTPSVVLCRARATKRERRKCWVEGELVGPNGVVYATSQYLYIEQKPKKDDANAKL